MTYQERNISKENLEKFLSNLDSDEGIRIDNDTYRVFVNKTSKRYCVNISKNNNDEFVYKDDAREAMDFLRNHLLDESKIFIY